MAPRLSTPLISVIVPVYNLERYIVRCLDSILRNSYGEIEVICIDDGSTDSSGEILEEYRRNDTRVRVVTKSNEGVTSARNAGVDAAKGEWICFVDGDDWVHHQYFESLVSAWRQDGCKADVVLGGAVIAEAPVPEEEYALANLSLDCIRWEDVCNQSTIQLCLWGRMYRRELIGDIRIPNSISYAEDFISNIFYYGNVKNIRMIRVNLAGYYYYQRLDSLCHTTSFCRQKEALDYVCNHLDAISLSQGKVYICSYLLRHLAFVHLITGDYYSLSESARFNDNVRKIVQALKGGACSIKERVRFGLSLLEARVTLYVPGAYLAMRMALSAKFAKLVRTERNMQSRRA